MVLVEGSLEVKLPTIWRDEKQSRAEAERRGRLEERRSEEKESGRKKMQMREKVGKSRNTVFFQWFVAPEGRKVGSLKRRVRSQLARWEMKNFAPRSTFPSQNVQNTSASDHFWKLRCRKNARRCGAKHISKSKVLKTGGLGPLLEVEMSKKCTPLWREAHFEVNVQNTPCSRHFWKFGCRKSARRCGAKHISKSKCKKHKGFGPLLEVQMSLRFTTLHYTTLHYTTLHYTTLHYTTLQLQLHNYTPLHSTTLNYTTLHYITLHSTTLHYTTLHYLPLHFTTLRYTPLHYNYNYTTTLHYNTLHYTPLHYNYITQHYNYNYTTLHYTTLHYTTFHYTSLHYTTLRSTTLQLQLQLRLHNYTPLHSTTRNYTTLHYITLHYTTFHYTPLHYTTLHYTTLHWMTLHHR